MKKLFVLLLLCLPYSSYAAGPSPELTLEQFYKAYFAYLESLNPPEGKPLPQDPAKELRVLHRFFTAKLIAEHEARNAKCAANKESGAACNANPFLCSQEQPTNFTLANVKAETESATGEVHLCFHCKQPKEEKRIVKTSLKLVDKKWKIDSLQCP